MLNITQGRKAEEVAAKFLLSKGYKVLSQNWKTPVCEIDIVAQKAKHIYFIEVKYRANTSYGSGLDYITPKKLKQMDFAAKIWVSQNKFEGDYSLAAIELTGPTYEVTNFLPDLT